MSFLSCPFGPCYRAVRAISSDRGKVVSGSDDQSVLVWDKQTTQLLEELKGHDAPVSLLTLLIMLTSYRTMENQALSCYIIMW